MRFDGIEGITDRGGSKQLRYTKNGFRRTELFSTREAAEARAEELRREFLESGRSEESRPAKRKRRRSVPKKIKQATGELATDWIHLMWELAIEVRRGEPDAIRQLQAIANAARSAQSLLDREKVEKAQAEIKRQFAEIVSAQKHGTRTTQGAAAIQQIIGPVQSVC